MPTRDKRVPAAKLSAGTIAPGTTREKTQAVRQPTATDSSQKPGASISATNNSREATSQTCHSCMAGKLARNEEAGNASSVFRSPAAALWVDFPDKTVGRLRAVSPCCPGIGQRTRVSLDPGLGSRTRGRDWI